MSRAPNDEHMPWHIGAALAAWLLPGLGHYLIGERQRGLIIGITIMVLWLAGLFIGGVSVIDTSAAWQWFIAQGCMAPSWLTNFYVQGARGTEGFEASFGRVAEQGILYTAMAGLLNVLAIIDVAYREPSEDMTHHLAEEGDAP